jgi:hypothetical protein
MYIVQCVIWTSHVLAGEAPCRIEVLSGLIIYCFTSRSKIFHLYRDITITGEGLQNLGLCSAFRAFDQGGIFIVPPAVIGALVFLVSSEGPPHSVAFYDSQGVAEDLFLPGSSRDRENQKLKSTNRTLQSFNDNYTSQILQMINLYLTDKVLKIRTTCLYFTVTTQKG